MRKVSDCFQHDLNRDVQIVIMMKLIDFQYGQVGFQIVCVLLGLHFHIVFERGQVLRIVSERVVKINKPALVGGLDRTRPWRVKRPTDKIRTSRFPVRGTRPFVSLLRPWFETDIRRWSTKLKVRINRAVSNVLRTYELVSYDFYLCSIFNINHGDRTTR